MTEITWDWDILIMRCGSCKGLVEGSPSESLEDTMRRHLKAVHGISAKSVERVTLSSTDSKVKAKTV